MEKRPIGYQPGKPSILDKRVPKSDKYAHIQSKLTGKIGTTVKDVEIMSNKQVSKRKGQLFKRIKPSTVWKMINQQTQGESIYGWTSNTQQPTITKGSSMHAPPSSYQEDDARSQTSNLTSVTIRTQQLPVGIQTDFLLLDLRQLDEYEQFHIKEALSYPGPNIKRDKMIPQLMNYRNKQNKIIVVYHFDQKKGIEFANQFLERGYDNVYLISGGIEAFGMEMNGQGLEGKNIPHFAKKQQVRKFKKQRLD